LCSSIGPKPKMCICTSTLTASLDINPGLNSLLYLSSSNKLLNVVDILLAKP